MMTNEDYQEAIRLERYAWARIKRLLHEVVQTADEYYIWRWGDGIGGSIQRELLAAASERGLPTTGDELYPNQVRVPKRKSMSAGKRYRIMERDGFACVQCGVQKRLVIDHIHPWSKGGTDDDENLQTLCHGCNTKKGTKVG